MIISSQKRQNKIEKTKKAPGNRIRVKEPVWFLTGRKLRFSSSNAHVIVFLYIPPPGDLTLLYTGSNFWYFTRGGAQCAPPC